MAMERGCKGYMFLNRTFTNFVLQKMALSVRVPQKLRDLTAKLVSIFKLRNSFFIAINCCYALVFHRIKSRKKESASDAQEWTEFRLADLSNSMKGPKVVVLVCSKILLSSCITYMCIFYFCSLVSNYRKFSWSVIWHTGTLTSLYTNYSYVRDNKKKIPFAHGSDVFLR